MVMPKNTPSDSKHLFQRRPQSRILDLKLTPDTCLNLGCLFPIL
jgi:hypothetical protein